MHFESGETYLEAIFFFFFYLSSLLFVSDGAMLTFLSSNVYKTMGKSFKGLAQSGVLVCFDEFNHIEQEVIVGPASWQN